MLLLFEIGIISKMPSSHNIRSFRKHHQRQRDKENKSPNIGELTPEVKADLSQRYEQIYKDQHRSHQTPTKDQSSHVLKNHNQNFEINHDNYNNATTAASYKPLSSTRDPRRRQLQSRVPFAPFSHGVVIHENDKNSSNKNAERRRRQKERRRRRIKDAGGGNTKGNISNKVSSYVSKKEITPAYAYKNAETGNLEISVYPPNYNDIDRFQSKSKASVPALYPIAINGGGSGVYTDPREFAKGGINALSQNRHESKTAPNRSYISFPWNMGNGTYSSEKLKKERKNTAMRGKYGDDSDDDDDSENDQKIEKDDDHLIDLESGLGHALKPVLINDDNGHRIFNPWKTWEKVHNYVVHVKERESHGQPIKIDFGDSPSSLSYSTMPGNSSHNIKPLQYKRTARVSSIYNDDDFDFAIVLQSKEVYSFWANLLDFREENGISIDDDDSDNGSCRYSLPSLGSKKRRRQDPSDGGSSTNEDEGPSIEQRRAYLVSSRYKNVSVDNRGHRTFVKQGGSLFDRAIATITPPRKKFSPVQSVAMSIRKSLSNRKLSTKDTPPSSSTTRRRWGNTAHRANISIMSPPIRSLRRKSPQRGNRNGSTPHPASTSNKTERNEDVKSRKKRKKNPHCLEIEDIPNQLIPRGIAARTNGMAEFLLALERGIVVRRHRPNHDPVFVKLISPDGGDTINFKFVLPEDAQIACKAQKVRYNKTKLKGIYDQKHVREARWFEENSEDRLSYDREQYNASLPEYIGRTSSGGGLKKTVVGKATKTFHSGTLKTKHIVAVARATHADPLSAANELGTPSLRETKNCLRRHFQKIIRQDMTQEEKNNLTNEMLFKEPCDERTFSLILPGLVSTMGAGLSSKNAHENYFNENYHNETAFRFLDFEAFSPGEYWMLFRGFLLLHRDAMSGRFASNRAGGFGSNYNQQELEQRGKELKKNSKLVNFCEPEDKSWLGKLIGKKNESLDSLDKDSRPKPPPSDYFLGFKSPGTQIWSRLRQAGLETKRIYGLDRKVVMIKIRCPSDRLMDVAEVLKLRMKTNDGYFEPFQEKLIDRFQEGIGSDCQRRCSSDTPSIFRSSVRQNIIDFIINSRIRDSGAELSRLTQLGKCIRLRVPMHMHARLEEIYNFWYFFYKRNYWNGDNMSIDTKRKQMKTPHIIKRFCYGCFYQPLDSIEQYFGERVAFYFAWLQHCSIHLTYISFLGLIVFICQMVSGTFDHVLRPYFSVVLMIWSFYVMVSWRKRQNFLAHRWGTMNYKQEETTRPQFRCEVQTCEITKRTILYYPSWKRWLKYCISVPLTLAFTVMSLIGFLIVHANRDIALARYFSEDDKRSIYDFNWSLAVIGEIETIGAVTLSRDNLRDFHFWYIVGAMPCALGLSLPLLNFILMQLSRRLNDFENYKTESQYLNALITKVIAFRFVTYFSALYYYAYISTGKDAVTVENSILRVATSLVIYLTVAHWWGNFLSIYVPLLVFRWRLHSKGINLGNELRELESLELERFRNKGLTQAQKKELDIKIANNAILLEQAQCKIWEEMMLPDYDPFFDYILAVIYFAFAICFSAMLPLTPLLVLINQLTNMRLNAYKICRSRRRPLSQKAGGVSYIIFLFRDNVAKTSDLTSHFVSSPLDWSLGTCFTYCYCHCNSDKLLADDTYKLPISIRQRLIWKYGSLCRYRWLGTCNVIHKIPYAFSCLSVSSLSCQRHQGRGVPKE